MRVTEIRKVGETEEQKTAEQATEEQDGGHYYFNPISRKRKMRSRSKTTKSR